MRALLLSACILFSTVVVNAADNIRGSESDLQGALWLLESGKNPCETLRARCDGYSYLIYRQIIMARERGDEQAAERWLNILWWYDYGADPRR